MTDFNSVNLGAHTAQSCTPEVPPDFIGLRIAAPEQVQFGQDKFAICGTYRFRADFLGRFQNPTWAVVLVAVDARTHRPFAANLHPPGATTPVRNPTEPPPDPDWMENHFIRRYFNVDLLRYLDIPRVDAAYWIYTLIEAHVSNVVRVACRGRE